MSELKTHKVPRKSFSSKIWASAVAGGAVLVAAFIIFVVPLINGDSVSTDPTATPTTSVSPQPATPASSTDNSSLNSDLNGINSSINQESSDQNSADSALDDSSQQITVPNS
ncbi:MAG: hypothetical protein ABI303_01125 [Candidatus Saccharimonas sp.]